MGSLQKLTLNGFLYELPIIQETWLMNMELENSSTDTGNHQNNMANNTTFGNGLSYHSRTIGSDFGNSRVEEITSYVRMASFFFFSFLVLEGFTASVRTCDEIHD